MLDWSRPATAARALHTVNRHSSCAGGLRLVGRGIGATCITAPQTGQCTLGCAGAAAAVSAVPAAMKATGPAPRVAASTSRTVARSGRFPERNSPKERTFTKPLGSTCCRKRAMNLSAGSVQVFVFLALT